MDLDSPDGESVEMSGIGSKRMADLTADDLDALVDSGAVEGEQIEFKVSPPGSSKVADPWGESRDFEKSRDKLLAEITAFANARGGDLVIGVAESKEKPAVASSVSPIPDAGDLCDRLLKAAAACIEPQIPQLNAVAIPYGGGADGVVVCRVPRSTQGPHRITTTKEIPIRRADRAENMLMREVHDLTLQLDRGMSRVEALLADRSAEFRASIPGDHRDDLIAVRVTVVPLWPIQLPPFERGASHMPQMRCLPLKSGEIEIGCSRPPYLNDERPIVRGWSRSRGTPRDGLVQIARQDGLGEIRLITEGRSLDDAFVVLDPPRVVPMVIGVLDLVEAFREAGEAPGADFVLDWELVTQGPRPKGLGTLNHHYWSRNLDEYRLSDAERFPRLSVLPEPDYPEVIREVLQDLLSCAGDEYRIEPIVIPAEPS